MEDKKFKSWCFTVRTGKGVPAVLRQKIIKWLKLQEGAYAVSEMKDEAEHIHGQVWLSKPRVRKDINQSLQRICKKIFDDWDWRNDKVLYKGTRIGYSDEYIAYMNKGDDNKKVDLLFTNIPEGTSGYYPSLEEQRQVQDKANAVDKRFHRWMENWRIYKDKHDVIGRYSEVRDFVMIAMYRDKTEPVLLRHRDRVDFCINLYMYVNSIITYMTEAELLTCENEVKEFEDPQKNARAIKEL